jgi:hypothetical protein
MTSLAVTDVTTHAAEPAAFTRTSAALFGRSSVKESLMAHNAKYGVKFVGYSAHVIRKGREVEYAALDFVTGRASVNADQGWVSSKRADLGAFVGNLPTLSTELQQRLWRRSDPSFKETDFTCGSEMVRMSCGENEICAAPEMDVSKFIRQITKRFLEIEAVLEQAELVGSRIKRRPYGEYIDEIRKTGLCRVEAFGFGLYLDGKLIFYPNYQVALVKSGRPNIFEVHTLDPNPETGNAH